MSALFENLHDLTTQFSWPDFLSISGTSYLLIFAAELGDKSQLVCMILAARYRAYPVIFGAILAFILLNTLAVIFGTAIADLLPEILVFSIVTLLFLLFGIHALRQPHNEEEQPITVKNYNHLILSTFLLITVAEFGDKTQLAIVALSSSNAPYAVWFGATIALISTTLLGVWAGRTFLQKIPLVVIHRISGTIFLALAFFAGYKVYLLYN